MNVTFETTTTHGLLANWLKLMRPHRNGYASRGP